jgi:flagellar motility protein MotE (MotC chaperone)
VRENPAIRVLAGIALALLLTAGQAAAAATGVAPTPPAASPAKEAPSEPDEDHEPERLPDNPLRPQGPAIDMPQEVVDMLKQRQLVIERREEALKVEETRLSVLKKDLEDMLARQQQLAKNAQAAAPKNGKPKGDAAATAVDQVVKMYETMPPEEAAARLEKLPTAMALQVLRSLKGKTAGTILASVKPDKAAKLTEQFLARAVNPKSVR